MLLRLWIFCVLLLCGRRAADDVVDKRRMVEMVGQHPPLPLHSLVAIRECKHDDPPSGTK